MAVAAKKKRALAKRKTNGASAIDLGKFRAELDPVGQELFDIAMSVPEEERMSEEEIRAELARRRGGVVIFNQQ